MNTDSKPTGISLECLKYWLHEKQTTVLAYIVMEPWKDLKPLMLAGPLALVRREFKVWIRYVLTKNLVFTLICWKLGRPGGGSSGGGGRGGGVDV